MYSTYDIFDELYGLRNIVDRFFTEHPVSTGRYDFPQVNMGEHDDTVEITALVPGVSQDSINLQLVDSSIIIEGEKKIDYREHPYIRKERSFGKFQKSVKLPYGVDHGRIEASLRDGILRIRLYKSEYAKPRKIEIR